MAKKKKSQKKQPDNIKVERARGFFAQRNYHFDNYDEDDKPKANFQTEAEWREAVTKQWTDAANEDTTKWALFIFHDADKKEDGTDKGLHAHIEIAFDNARMTTAVIKLLGCSSWQNCRPVKSYCDSARYLTHTSEQAMNDGKHRYPISLVHAIKIDYSEAIKRSQDKKQRIDGDLIYASVAQISSDLEDGKLLVNQVRDRLIHELGTTTGQMQWRNGRQAFMEDRLDYLKRKGYVAKQGDRDLKNIYIYGIGGVGKSQLAKMLARLLSDTGGDYHASSVGGKGKTFDFASNYDGQNVSVLNDIDSSYFDLREFLNAFDNHQWAPVSSRNYDKNWLANYAIMTNSEQFTDFWKKLMIYSKGGKQFIDPSYATSMMPADQMPPLSTSKYTQDVANQIIRRFFTVIHVVPGNTEHSATAILNRIVHVPAGTCGNAEPIYTTQSEVDLNKLIRIDCPDVTDDSKLQKWAEDILTQLGLADEIHDI